MYNALTDHFNHAFAKNNITPFYKTYVFCKDIEILMDWIDSQPEYALILSSDHGGQLYYG